MMQFYQKKCETMELFKKMLNLEADLAFSFYI